MCAVLLVFGWPSSGYSQIALTTVAAGTNPSPIVLNPVTNRIYSASYQDGTVTVIDGATNLVLATVTVGTPGALAVNPATNKIYVADTNTNTVTVIDGATNLASSTLITVGSTPIAVAVNPVTNMIYVGNQVSNNVSVIDGSTDTNILTLAAGNNPQVIGVNPVTNKIYVVNNASGNVTVIDGTTTPQSVIGTVTVGPNALSIAVNPATNLIYVANSGNATVTVINGAINTTASSLTVTVGAQPRVLTVNPVTNKIYVANHTPGTVTVIDGTLNTTASNLTITVGTAPVAIAVNPTTNQIYVANHTSGSGGGTLSVINGAVNTTASTTTVAFAVGAFPVTLAVNPVTNQVYAADQMSDDVTVFTGSTDVTAAVTVGTQPSFVAVNPATNQIYAANATDGTVTVTDGLTNTTTTVTVGDTPTAVAVNPVTNQIYVLTCGSDPSCASAGSVTVIDANNSNATSAVAVGLTPQAIAVNPVTNQVYVSNSCGADPTCMSVGSVTVIDANNGNAITTLAVGHDPTSLALNLVTNKIYISNSIDSTVSIIDGAAGSSPAAVEATAVSVGISPGVLRVNPVTNKIYVIAGGNNLNVIDGATAVASAPVSVGTSPIDLAVNAVTNKIYVDNEFSHSVSVLDGASGTVTATVQTGSLPFRLAVNPVTNKIYSLNQSNNTVTVIDGATNITNTVAVGITPFGVAVNPATNQIYVINSCGTDATCASPGNMTVIAEERVQAVPLITTIAANPGGISSTLPALTFTAASTFAPDPTTVEHVYFQLDTWEGPWIAATPGTGNFTATPSASVQQGTHIVYAFATDGQEANSAGTTQQLIGPIAAQVFTAILSRTTTSLTSDENPAGTGDTVTFSVSLSSRGAGTLTGTVEFFDGITPLGPATVAAGAATFQTSALALGSHSITAVYSGDGNFAGSTSPVLVEVIVTPNAIPGVASISPTSANAGGAGFTLTVNGTGFISTSVVDWNGTPLVTTLVNATQLTALVPVGDLVSGGTISITVVTPAPGGGTSPSPATFTVDNLVAVLASALPNSATAGGASFTVTVNGASFVGGSLVEWNGAPLTTVFVSAAQLTATVPSTDILTASSALVTVLNPTPGGGASSPLSFSIVNPIPIIGPVATLPVGAGPSATAINPLTNKIYVANSGDSSVSVIDGATNTVTAVGTGTTPVSVAVNPVTNQIYVANQNSSSVTIIDGATNATTTVSVGTSPDYLAVNPVTNKIYVADYIGNNVTVIDGASNTTSTVATGLRPEAIAVNPVTNKIYVVNYVANTVTVIDGATNNVVSTVNVGARPTSVAANPVTNVIYVANGSDNTLSVIDGASNTIVTTLPVGQFPQNLAVNPVTNKIFVSNTVSGTVTVIDGASETVVMTVPVQLVAGRISVNPGTNQIYVANECGTDSSCSSPGSVTVIDGTTYAATSYPAGLSPTDALVNPVTNQVYVPNDGDSTVTVLSGATNLMATVAVGTQPQAIAVNPATNEIYVANATAGTVTAINGLTNAPSAPITVGTFPAYIAVDPVTDMIYVVNQNSSDVTVIDGSSNTTTTVTTGSVPDAIAVNPVTDTIYVTNDSSNNVTAIDGASNTVTATISVGTTPQSLAVNPVTNQIYVADQGSGDVKVIDGGTNTVTATVMAGTSPQGVAVNPVTNQIYIINSGSSNMTLINGATNVPTTLAVGHTPNAIAVNPVTNRIYVLNACGADLSCNSGGSVTVIDGLTNTVSATVTAGFLPSTLAVNLATNKVYVANNCGSDISCSSAGTVTVIDGATNDVSTLPVGSGPFALALNLATSKIYEGNQNDNTVTVISEEQTQPVPLTTTIAPLPGNISATSTPTFTFTAASAFAPNAPIIENVYFQLDTLEGPWVAATPGSGTFTGTVSPALLPGTHVVYAYPVDGQDATSTGQGQQLVGQVTTQVFTVILPATTTTLVSSENPAGVGDTVTFTATVGSVTAGTPTGTVTFYDGSSVLGPGTVASGIATFATSTLTLGSHSIKAVYSGDANFAGSASAVLTEVEATPNPVPTTGTLSPTSATAGGAAFTLTVAGTNFVNGSIVEWNGVALATVFGSATQLTATVPVADIANGKTVPVTVFNPAPDGGTSTPPLSFTINNPVAEIESLSQISATAGGASFTLTVTGGNFNATSLVEWNGTPLATIFIDASHISATVPASDIAAGGTASVTAFNPTPGGGVSDPVTFTANDPVPVQTALAPTSAVVGGAAFVLTVNGSNFVVGTAVLWNGAALTTTLVSPTQLTAAVPAADLLTVGSATVTVFNPAPAGGTSGPQTFTITATNPVPVAGSLSPSSATAGSSAITLTVTGSGFAGGATVQWSGVPLTTTFNSSSQLMAAVPSTDLANGGTVSVTVVNVAPGGGTSSSLTFTIDNPVSVAGSLSLTSALVGSPGFNLVVTGTGFVSSSIVRWNGVALVTTVVSATQLTAAVPASDLAAAGTASVTVFSPAPGGGASNALTFTITGTNPTPTLGSLSQTSTIAGGPPLTLTITGTNFVTGTVVEWNGTALATALVNGTQLTAVIPAADIANGGTASLTVFNPTPGGGTSSAITFTINDPVPALESLSETTTTSGGPAFTLTVTGASFVPGTIVKWNGAALVTTFVNAAQVTAAVPASDTTTGGSVSVTVFNPAPGGGTSAAVTLTIVDFSVSSPTGPLTSEAGQAVMFTIATAPVGGPFPSPVTFTASGLPPGSAATFNPVSVTPGTSTTMTVTTTARTTTASTPPPFGPRGPWSPNSFPSWPAALLLGMSLGALTLAKAHGKMRRRLIPFAVLALLIVTAGYLAGCTGEGFPRLGVTAGTPAGSYSITVKGASGTDVHSTTVTLIVE